MPQGRKSHSQSEKLKSEADGTKEATRVASESNKVTPTLDVDPPDDTRRDTRSARASSATFVKPDSQRNQGSAAQTKSKPGDASEADSEKPSHKRRAIILAATAALLIVTVVTVGICMMRGSAPKASKRTSTKVVVAPAKPKTSPSPLTGIEVSPERAEHPVYSVVIENLYPSARPQSGLSSAGIVYETLSEGGITRYQAFFGDTIPTDIGPVRSLRTFFVRWGIEYDAPVVHAGGNIDALDLIGPLGMKNLDQFVNGSYFRRITSRYAPHNLYTSGELMDKLLQVRGYNTKPTFTPWQRKDDAKATSPTAASITVDPSFPDYKVTYTYNPTDNTYTRFIRGAADVDANGNTPIAPKNVIVLKARVSYGVTRANTQATYIQTVGAGSGVIFMDGKATEITWRKPSDKARTQFFDASGKEVALNRGQTWVTVIPLEKTVSYQ